MADFEQATVNAALERKAVRLCRDDMQHNRWSEILERTSDVDFCFASPRLLLQRLQAAARLKKVDQVKEIASRATNSDLLHATKFAIARILSADSFSDLAVLMLVSDRNLREDPQFLRLLGRYSVNIKDRNLRREARIAPKIFSRGGSSIIPMRSDYAFEPQVISHDLGTIGVFGASCVDSLHKKALRADLAKTRRLLLNPVQPEVIEYKDVFTDQFGQIWNSKKQIIYSRGENILEFEPSRVNSIPFAYSASRASRGIYHWLIDYLPGFSWINRSGVLNNGQLSILLSGRRDFEHETLDLLGLQHTVISLEGPIFVERLLLTRLEFSNLAGWTHLDSLFETIGERSDALARQKGLTFPERVYVTRRDAVRRHLVNEAEVEAEAVRHGFVVIEFSKLPLWHKIALARHAHTIMGPHGAGLAHTVFSRPGTRVIELMPIRSGTYDLRFSFARLSLLKRLDHIVWMDNQPFGADSWTIDIKEFRSFLTTSMR